MGLWILRIVFVVAAFGVGYSVVMSEDGVRLEHREWVVILTVLCSLAIVTLDVLVPRKRIEVISCVYFGVVIGLFLTYVVGMVVKPLMLNENQQPNRYYDITQLMLGVGLCYACISLLFQTRDDFRFIIPYVEFSKEVKGIKPYILDTSVVIDGRIADLVETNIFDNQLIMPRFVLGELQGIADSSDKLRRSRGRRGLDILNRLRNNDDVDLKVYDRELPEFAGQPVDMKLVLLAKHLEGKVVTGDYNLNKVARVQNVDVVNLNDIANSLKPQLLPGEKFSVRLVKAGEGPAQGIGYLDDGTMIVVEGGRDHINKTVTVSVTSVLQKSAGRMIFGAYEGPAEIKSA